MKLQILKTIVFLNVLTLCAQSFALDPRVELNKISSENFDIIYDAKSYELAKIYLEEAERSHKILKDVFGISPSKTTVVLDDSYDLANGSATAVPRPHITIYVNPPTPLSSIDHFSNWPRDVFLHEYAHILNMEPSNGAWKPLRYIFGSYMRPNMFLPRWYLEGLAVEMESRYNEFGRLKSSDYDGLIRSLYIDQKWGIDNLSQINESSTPYWPAGQRPYFYGALIWHDLIQAKDVGVVQRFNDHYSRRFPFFISHPMVKEMGKTYQDFLVDVYKKYGDLAQKQIAKIKEQPVSEGKILAQNNERNEFSPILSPDGQKLAMVTSNVDGDMGVRIYVKVEGQWKLDDSDSTEFSKRKFFEQKKYDMTRVSWFPGNEKLVYDAADIFDHRFVYYDLYSYDFNNNKRKQITKGLRAREPAVSPNGQEIVFVKAGVGKTAIYTVNFEGKNPQMIYTPPGYERVSNPSYVSEKEIIFSQKDRSGKDKLHLFNLESKKIVKILDMHAKFPNVVSEGIVFTSNQSGVENLYIASKDLSSVRPLTNSLTRVVNGTYDGASIIYSELTGHGPKIKTIETTKTLKVLPTVAHMIKKDFPEKISDEVPAVTAEPKKYSPLPYMAPQYWVPYFATVEDGTVGSIAIPGSDPTGFHSYLLQASYDSRPEKYSGYFGYMWVNTLGQTVFNAADYYHYYASTEETTNSESFSIIHGFYLPKLSNSWQGLLGYEYKKMNVLESGEKRNHYFDGPSVGFSYENMEQDNLAISPTGLAAKVKYTNYFSNSTKTDYKETFAKFNYYFNGLLPKRHVLAFTTQGVYSERNRHIRLGTTSSDTEIGYTLGTNNDNFITRGYPSGEFIGYTMVAGSLEYRFPIYDRWKGPNSPAPYYIKRYHGAVFAETLTLDGIAYDEDDVSFRSELGKYYTTAGIELKMDTTILYHAPVTVKAILAYGFEKEANGGFTGNLVLMAPEIF